MDALLGIDVEVPNEAHVPRAVTGLYWGMAALWLAGALNAAYTRPAPTSDARHLSVFDLHPRPWRRPPFAVSPTTGTTSP